MSHTRVPPRRGPPGSPIGLGGRKTACVQVILVRNGKSCPGPATLERTRDRKGTCNQERDILSATRAKRLWLVYQAIIWRTRLSRRHMQGYVKLHCKLEILFKLASVQISNGQTLQMTQSRHLSCCKSKNLIATFTTAGVGRSNTPPAYGEGARRSRTDP